jgi:hypothetical protein
MTAAASLPAHGGGVRPLLHAGSRVLVDGHPICADCGRAVRPIGPDRWRHLAVGERLRGRSKWLSPGLAELRRCRTYAKFMASYPSIAASEGEWHEAVRRLERYHTRLRALRRAKGLLAGANPYRELVDLLSEPPGELEPAPTAYWGLPVGLAQLLDLSERRRELVELFAWAVPTDEALEAIARYAPLVECGAGTGYWTALLQARGVDVVAYDLAPPGTAASNRDHRSRRTPWAAVRHGSAVSAVRRHPHRTLVLCWPPYDDDAASYEPLRAYRGEVVVYVGEQEGASGSVRFHRELRLNWTVVEQVELPRWPRLDDRLTVYRRNAVRRPQRQRDRCAECGRFRPAGSIGRCDTCIARRPAALTLRVGRHRIEYSEEALESMPVALRRAFETSPQRVR